MRQLLIVFLLLFLAGCPKQYELSLDAPWWTTPNVEICEDSPVDVEDVLDALEWWEDISHEYEVGEILIGATCEEPTDIGTIRVTRADPDYLKQRGAEAYARWDTFNPIIMTDDPDAPDEIVGWAEVFLAPGNGKWTIRHEFGHAFGWNHVLFDDKWHVMSKSSGWIKQGLEDYRNLRWYDNAHDDL